MEDKFRLNILDRAMRKKILDILLAIFVCYSVTAQDREASSSVVDEHAIIPTSEDYLILGTFSDYMEYYGIDTANCEVDHYDYHIEKLAYYIHSLLTARYGDNVKMKKIPNRYYIYSCRQSEILSLLYRQSNNLSDNNFPDRESALSYMHGVYLRFSQPQDDTLHCISVYNSRHGRLFYKIASSFGFTNLNIEELNTIPHTTKVYFTPTEEFLEFVQPTAELKRKLQIDYEKMLRKRLGISARKMKALKKKYGN